MSDFDFQPSYVKIHADIYNSQSRIGKYLEAKVIEMQECIDKMSETLKFTGLADPTIYERVIKCLNDPIVKKYVKNPEEKPNLTKQQQT